MIGGRWGYAYDRQLTCSYHCMRAMWRADMEGDYDMPMKKGTKMHYLTEEEKQKIRELRELGFRYREIAEKIGGAINDKSIAAYCSRMGIKPAADIQEEEPVEVHDTDQEEADQEHEEELHINKARIANVLIDIAQILIDIYRE